MLFLAIVLVTAFNEIECEYSNICAEIINRNIDGVLRGNVAILTESYFLELYIGCI